MSRFDEQPDADPHGECAAEIHRLQAEVTRTEQELAQAKEDFKILQGHFSLTVLERNALLDKRAALDGQEAENLLSELVFALESTNWSSWQTTAKFSDQFERAKLYLAAGAKESNHGRYGRSLERAPRLHQGAESRSRSTLSSVQGHTAQGATQDSHAGAEMLVRVSRHTEKGEAMTSSERFETHLSKRPVMAVPTLEGMTDAIEALQASCEAGKWTLLAPDGRVWMNQDPMILFAALAALLRGETLTFGELLNEQ